MNERQCRPRQKPFQNEEKLYVGLSSQKATATTDERLINSLWSTEMENVREMRKK